MEQSSNILNLSMARLAAGERRLFTQVFEVLWPSVNRLCRQLLKNDADAADASQEAMCKIFERVGDYDASRPAMPWALAIAGWECRTIMTKRSRRKEVADQTNEARHIGNLEDELIHRDLVQAAMIAFEELSDLDRETLLETFMHEAQFSGGATIRKRRQRAFERLRQAFRRLYGTE